MAVNSASAFFMLKLLEKIRDPSTTPKLDGYKVFLNTLLLFDRPDDALLAFATSMDVTLHYWKDVVAEGLKAG